jgi:preprotein translocase subunit SecE
MAAATNTNEAGTTPAPTKGTETVHTGPIHSKSKPAEESATAGFDWTIFWLVVGIAVFVFLWRKGYIGAFRKFIGETREQLHKCTWPTMDELKQHIVVVMISSVMLGVFTVFSDKIVRFIVWDLLMGSDSGS